MQNSGLMQVPAKLNKIFLFLRLNSEFINPSVLYIGNCYFIPLSWWKVFSTKIEGDIFGSRERKACRRHQVNPYTSVSSCKCRSTFLKIAAAVEETGGL